MGEFISEIFGELFKLLLRGLWALVRSVLEVMFEASGEIISNVMGAPFRSAGPPGMAAIGYAVYGALAGGISLLVFHVHVLSGSWREINLVAAPVAAGLAWCAVQWVWGRARHALLQRERFVYGYVFALALVMVRYWFAG